MTIENLSQLVITAGVAGASGAFVKELASNATEWLVALVAAQSPKVREKAEKNLRSFVNRLAERVKRLEEDLPPQQGEIFQDALSHPGTALLLRKACESASATANDDRHAILSELISQRLTSNADDMIALAGNAACDVVNSLSSKHIRLLGVMATLFRIRPTFPAEANTQELYNNSVKVWWDQQFTKLCTSDLNKTTNLDFEHLVGLSCIRMSIGSFKLDNFLSLKMLSGSFKADVDLFQDCSWFSTLKYIWDSGCKSTSLTSVGSLIGTLFHDQELSVKTTINW